MIFRKTSRKRKARAKKTYSKKQSRLDRSTQLETLDPRVMLDAHGAVFFGPSEYLSEADVPDDFLPAISAHCSACEASVETFEDGTLDFGLTISEGEIIGPGFSSGLDDLTDSVDGDDGEIDGTGQSNGKGYSYFSETNVVTVTFPDIQQSAGIVWTDGDTRLTNVIFEAFDENGDSLGTVHGGDLADNSFMGTTAEDRFFGASYGDGESTGISAIQVTNIGGIGIEIDHITFANCAECVSCSDVLIDKFLWDVNSDPNIHVDIEAGDELFYAFEVTNTGCDKLNNVTVTDDLPGFVMDEQVLEWHIPVSQDLEVPADGNLGPYASLSLDELAGDGSDEFEAKAWDNFTLGEATVLSGLEWAGAYVEPFAAGSSPTTNFRVEIVPDDGSNAPDVAAPVTFEIDLDGGIAGVSDGAVTSTLLAHTAEDDGPAYAYQAALPWPVIPAGKHWISITALQTFPSEAPTIDPTWQWHLAESDGADGFWSFDDTFDDPGDNNNGYVDTDPRPALWQEDKDLTFTLHAQRQVDFNGMLQPGERVEFMGRYTVTEADVAAGQITNTGVVTADGTKGSVMDEDTLVTEIHSKSSIEIDKFLWDINDNLHLHSDIHAGDLLFYGFKVTNDGEKKLSNVEVSDALLTVDADQLEAYTAWDQPAFDPADGDLGPFASVSLDELAGDGSDEFEAKAWDNFSLPETTVIESVEWQGAYLESFATGAGSGTPQTDFLIEFYEDDSDNPGASPVHSFTIDGGDAGVDDGFVKTTLVSSDGAADGGPVYSYEAKLDDFTVFTSGEYWISITALQTFPSDDPIIDPTWQWQLGSGSGDGFWTFDDTFDDPGDDGLGLVDTDPRPATREADKDLSFKLNAFRRVDFDGMLEPGEMIFFMGTYEVSHEDVYAGEVVNKGIVTANTPSGSSVMDMDTEVVRIDNNASLDIDKFLWDINGSPYLHTDIMAGDELIYAFKVTNDGDAKVKDLKLTDPLPGLVMDPDVLEPYTAFDQSPYVPGDGNLGPFASVSLDELNGDGSDEFEAKAWDNFSVSELTILEAIDWEGAYLEPFAAGLTPQTDFLIEFFTDDSGKPDASALYSYHIGGGDAGVNDASVMTTLLGHTAEEGGPVYSYGAKLAEFPQFDAGSYWVSITALQTFPNADPVIDPTWQWHLGSGSGDGFWTFDDTFDDPGDGGKGLEDTAPRPVNHEDGKDLAFTLHAARRNGDFNGMLKPGEMVVYMGTYIVTQDDVDRGEIVNKAVIMGMGPNGHVMDMDTETVTIDPQSAIEIDKYLWDINASPYLHTCIAEGDELIYAFDVTNTGTTVLSHVEVSDALPGVVMQDQVMMPYTAHDQKPYTPADGNLGPFASVSLDELAKDGSDEFEAKAWDNFSVDPGGEVIEAVSWAGAYIEPFATTGLTPKTDFLIEFFKNDAGDKPLATPLESFVLKGGLAGVDDAHVRTHLIDPAGAEEGGPVYGYKAMLPKFVPLVAGDYWISITALQTFPNAFPTVDPTWQWHLGSHPSGTADGFYHYDDTFDDPGDLGVGKDDQAPSPANFEPDKDLAFKLHAGKLIDFDGTLHPGETVTFMADYVVTADDVAAGGVMNKGTVTAWKPTGGMVMDMDTEKVKIGSAIDIDKFLWDINGSPHLHHNLEVGDELIYSFNVTNTCNVKLSDVSVHDPLPGLVMDEQVAEMYIAHDQPFEVPSSGELGPYSSVSLDELNGDGSDEFEAKAWDNFTLSGGTVIDGISWVGAYDESFATGPGSATPQTDFRIEIFKDDGGVPGEVVLDEMVDGNDAGADDSLNLKTKKLHHHSPSGGPVFKYNAMLPLTGVYAGDYWVSITAMQTFPSDDPVVDPTWQWHLGKSDGSADGFYFFDDTFDDPGDNDQGDEDTSPRPANFEPDKDLAFTIHAARLVDFDGMLDPGESVMFMGTYYVTADDVAAGVIVNTATATGTLPSGTGVSDDDTFSFDIVKPLPPQYHIADVNQNGKVDFADFLIVSGNFGNKDATHGEGDIDGDGSVAFADFLLLSQHFGKEGPEPSATDAALAALADDDEDLLFG